MLDTLTHDFREAVLPASQARLPRLTAGEEKRFILQWQREQDSQALDTLVRYFSGFCDKRARRFKRMFPSLSLDDLQQEARMGFIEGVRRFDLEKPFRLATYAHYWVLACLEEYARCNRTIHKTPSNSNAADVALLYEYNHLMEQHRRRKGYRPPSYEEEEVMERALGCPLDEIQRKKVQFYGDAASLNAPLRSGDFTLGDILVDGADSPEDQAGRKMDIDFIRNLFERTKLTEKQRQIIGMMFFSRPDGETLSKAQVAKALGGKTEQNVRMIYRGALLRMFNAALAAGAVPYENDGEKVSQRRHALRPT